MLLSLFTLIVSKIVGIASPCCRLFVDGIIPPWTPQITFTLPRVLCKDKDAGVFVCPAVALISFFPLSSPHSHRLFRGAGSLTRQREGERCVAHGFGVDFSLLSAITVEFINAKSCSCDVAGGSGVHGTGSKFSSVSSM